MQFHGAKWWKFDFHTHTPISIDYGKGPNQQALKARSPREWLLDHMEKQIDCVAVTDHNSGKWIDTLKDELNLMREEQVDGFRELTIFPGVEITVHGNIHLLAIFDPSETSVRISKLLSDCKYEGKDGESDDCTTKSFNDVVDIIHEMKGLAIPAHVDIVRGLFVEEEGNSLRKCLGASGLLAMQVCDSTYEKPQIYHEMKINLTEIAGSDSHHPEYVSSSFSWVKMEVPNLEALRLALHDGEDGVIRSDAMIENPNDTHERFFIKSIEIYSGAKAGRPSPLIVQFSPWLNTVIGGRGSGKSSLIEYMRLPLGKITGLPHKVNEEFREFNQVPKERGRPGMLTPATKIRVEMQKDGRNIAFSWSNNKITEEHKNVAGEWEEKDESSNIDTRFPIRIFSQKHLYSLTEDPNHILNIIDQQFDKPAWIAKKAELAQKFLGLRNKYRELQSKINTKGNLKSELDDVQAKMKIFEESGHKELLERYQQTETLNEKINCEIDKVTNLTGILEGISIPELLFNSDVFSALGDESHEKLKQETLEYNNLTSQINELFLKLKAFQAQLIDTADRISWKSERLENQRKYLELVQRLEEKGEKNPNAYGEHVSKKRELEEKITEVEKLEEQMNLKNEESKSAYLEIVKHEKELREKREKAIRNWQGTNPHIRIYLKVMGNITNAEESFRSLIRKSGNEFAKDILERDEDGVPKNGIILDLMKADDPWKRRTELITKITSVTEQETNGFGKFFTKHLVAQKTNTPEDTDRIYLWFPEDKIDLKLVTNRKEEDIETGSAGQRTAAMLSLMLLLDDSPIIIDQPEEDLDTKRITDLVVTSLRQFKKKQQVIVITHNPNIPVNAAAENIIQMNFAGGQILKHISGALQKTDIREAVCEVMEGGKEALDKRYFRISKALEE
jgi:DNA repair ATPase RecN